MIEPSTKPESEAEAKCAMRAGIESIVAQFPQADKSTTLTRTYDPTLWASFAIVLRTEVAKVSPMPACEV
jgi:hypothetical protein